MLSNAFLRLEVNAATIIRQITGNQCRPAEFGVMGTTREAWCSKRSPRSSALGLGISQGRIWGIRKVAIGHCRSLINLLHSLAVHASLDKDAQKTSLIGLAARGACKFVTLAASVRAFSSSRKTPKPAKALMRDSSTDSCILVRLTPEDVTAWN